MNTMTLTVPSQTSCRQGPCAQSPSALRRLSGWLGRLMLDPRSRHLAGARDCADLERRMREWDECERRSAMFVCLP